MMYEEQGKLTVERMTTAKEKLTAKEKMKIIILYHIANKKWVRGTLITKEKIAVYIDKYDPTTYRMAHEFLEGAGLIVNDVIIEEKVPDWLMKRYEVVLDGKN